MNRRQFAIRLGGILALAAVSPTLQGCVNVTSLANTFIAALKAIVAADPTAPYVAELNLAIQALQTAVAGWNGSSVNCALQSAANVAVEIINQIAPTSIVATVAAVAVAGFDVLMANLLPCTTPAPAVAHALGRASSSLRTSGAYTAAHTRIQGATFKVHAFKAQFNSVAKDGGLSVRI
jgi:hypothetical protein